MSQRLILACLGNPGSEYDWTPHNVGHHVGDELVRAHGSGRWRSLNRAYHRADIELAGSPVIVIKPRTYMNRSGGALLALAQQEPFEPSELLVVVDDFALDWGRLRLRRRGTHGGHNGLRSIIDCLKTSDFPRLRIGVGPVPPGDDPADYVLEEVPESGRETMHKAVLRANECIEDAIRGGFDRAMSLYNTAPSESD